MNPEILKNEEITPFEATSESLRKEFADDKDLQVSFTIEGDSTIQLKFKFNEVGFKIPLNRAEKILKENGFEIDRIQTAGNLFSDYLIYPKMIDGKINWRRWLPYPQNFSPENQAILDELSGFPEMQAPVESFPGDSLGKFNKFVNMGLDLGLIKKEEADNIKIQYHRVAHAN